MIEAILQGLGSATFFASRAFVPAFVTALLLRVGPSLPLLGSADLLESLPDAPHWFTAWPTILLLGALAAAEVLSDKSSDAREFLDQFGRFLKPAMAVLTVLGVAGAADADFVERALDGGIAPKKGDLGGGLLAVAAGAGTIALTALRAGLLELLREGDQDDDAGVQGLLSWAEDVWAAFGPLLLVLFPIMMGVLIGLVTWLLHRLRQRAERREEQSRVACSGCGEPTFRCALRCARCGHAVAAPCDVGFFGTSVERPAPDPALHPFRLVEKKRCPSCATRLPERRPHQACPACRQEPFADPAFLERYLGCVARRVPRTLLLCTLFSLVPVAGLMPGVIYYRMALVAPFRRYVPRGRSLVLKWGVRLLFLVLVCIQWIPAVGGVVVPTMALVNYFAWRAAFLSVAREPELAPAVA